MREPIVADPVAPTRGFHAVILAAGLGSRLRAALGDLPKPLLRVAGRSLIERSVACLGRHGLASLTVVVGYGAEALRSTLAALAPGARIVENPAPAENGSMRSLALAVEAWGEACPEEALVVEGDLLYGPDALEALAGAPRADATVLCSTPTGAGDEVWVLGRGDRVSEIGKSPSGPAPVLGELVGLSRVSRETLWAMAAGHRAGGVASQTEHYEERLATLAEERAIRAVVVEGLVWAEIDDVRHLERALNVVLPALEARAITARD